MDFTLWFLFLIGMAVRLTNDTRNKLATALRDDIDAGAGPGVIEIRTGPQPADVDDADSGTLLATLTCSDPSAPVPVDGVLTLSAITSDTNADASGTAGHFRVKDSSGNVVADGTCGQGSGDLSFDNNVIVAGGTVATSSFVITVPA